MDQTCSAPAGPAGLTVQVCFPGVRAAVLDNLNRQREEGRLCDLSIQVQGQVFRAHRCVLAASSPYFHDQVLLKNVTTVSLPSVMDPVAFESVLSSAYTGQLSIVHDDIVNYVTVASFLQMWHIVDKCTEILKRPRPSADMGPGEAPPAAPGSASRQQSPSSTDCLYLEREERRKERNPDALPPLATWRRPQQFPRWGRPKPSSAQHLADSQLDSFPGCAATEYSNCEEAWVSSHAKTSHFGHDGPGHYSRHHGGFSGGEPSKQKARFTPRGPPLSADRLLEKNRENRESDELQEKRRNGRREIEADEGVGEQGERKESCAEMEHGDFRQSTNEREEVGQAVGKGGAEEKAGSNPTADVPALHACETAGPVPARLPWQAGSWSQPEPRLQEAAGGPCSKDEEFECFGRETYDEIEDGTGQVSQRPLVPVSPDFTTTGSEGTWSSTGVGQGRSLTPTSSRHQSPPTASFPPSSSSPPTPSSSSSVSLAGAPYTGKVHFCHCGKAYTLKSMRDRHVKMQHLNLRPFGCPVCAKTFKMKHHLTKHLKTHGGLRPYECNLCGKKVIWRDSFLRHQARCERLASGPSANPSATVAAAADVDEGCGYGFEDGEAFLPTGGQVKVEQVDFQGEMEDRMDGLLGSVSGIVGNLRCQTQNLDTSSHVFKEEERESFG